MGDPMALNPIEIAPKPHPLDFSQSHLARIKLIVFGALLTFSFVPIPIYINLSQAILLGLCVVTLFVHILTFKFDSFAALLLIPLISISQSIGITHSPSDERNYLSPFLFVTTLLIGPVMMILAKSCSSANLDRTVLRVVNWILTALAIECVTRFIFSPHMGVTAETDISDSFYLYKTSLFHYNSNFVGIEILCLLSIMFAFKEEIGRKKWLLVYLLLFASLSRASIAAGICQLVVYKFWRWRGRILFALLAAQLFIVSRLLVDYSARGPDATLAVDGSFSTKFLILSQMVSIYNNSSAVQRLFGVGAGNFINLSGVFPADNILATFVTELGIVGSLLLVGYIWILSRKCPASIYLLVLPVVVNGFSAVSTSMPYFIAALGLLGALRGSNRDGPCISGEKQQIANA